MDKSKIISFDNEFSEINKTVTEAEDKTDLLHSEIEETSAEIADLIDELKDLPGALFLLEKEAEATAIDDLNNHISKIVIPDYKDKLCLTPIDITVATVAGIIAAVIDIAFVGTPEVVKIYKGGKNFDGSVLTKAFRSIGNGDDSFSEILKWLSDRCKVPYDISAVKGVVYPDNHRLRSFGHDPLIGLLFAIADIVFGTCSVIDNDGNFRILINNKQFPEHQKYLAVIYYLGHLLSDVCTSRGIPIPGFILTQFFEDGSDRSFAKIAEEMYRDGYDLRHLTSMSVPVMVKDLIINIYIKLFKDDELNHISTIAENEIFNNKNEIFKHKMILISDAISCSGNVLKFFLPPTSGSPTALNIVEWCSLIKSTITNVSYLKRDKTVEEVIYNRAVIDDNWKILLESQKNFDVTKEV